MAKKGCASGCLRVFIVMIFCVALLAVGGYFGGNYLLKRYIGDEGEFAQLGINNWSELLEAYNGFKSITSGTPPAVDSQDKPSEENKQSAQSNLNNSIEGYDEDTGLFGGGDFVFNSKLVLNGGELAAILETERSKAQGLSDMLPFEFAVYAVSLNSMSSNPDADPIVYDLSSITIILEIDSSAIKGLVASSGMPGANFLPISEGKMYMSIGNGLKSVNGIVEVNNDAAKTVALNDNSAANQKILNIILGASGQTSSGLADTFANELVDKLNEIGSVTFAKQGEISVVEFDNKYNSDWVSRLGFLNGINIEDYVDIATELNDIKIIIGESRVILSKTEIDSASVALVEVRVASIEQAWEDLNSATNPQSSDTDALKTAAEALLNDLDGQGN